MYFIQVSNGNVSNSKVSDWWISEAKRKLFSDVFLKSLNFVEDTWSEDFLNLILDKATHRITLC